MEIILWTLNNQNIFHEAVHSSVRNSGSLADADNFVEKKLLFVLQEVTVFLLSKTEFTSKIWF